MRDMAIARFIGFTRTEAQKYCCALRDHPQAHLHQPTPRRPQRASRSDIREDRGSAG